MHTTLTIRFSLAAVFVAGLLPVSPSLVAQAADESIPTAILVGGETAAVELGSIELGGVYPFEVSPIARSVAREKLVRWGHPVEAPDGRIALLADGSAIVAREWSGGRDDESLRLDDDSLTFIPSLLERVTIPRSLVRAIVVELPADRAERDRLLAAARSTRHEEDSVLVRGGDRLTGRVARLDGQHLSIETSLGMVEAPLAGVVAVILSSPRAAPPADQRGMTLIGLSDGSLLAVREFASADDALVMTLTGGVALRGGTAEHVVFVQPFHDGVAYLSDLEPHRFVHVPYLDLAWPLGGDANVLGGRLRSGGKLFVKGLGVHSAARLVYRLDGSRERFAALAAIDDAAGRRGSAVFRVLLAEGDAWREAYTSPVVRGGDVPVAVSVPLGAAKGLALVVDYADRGDELDYANWLEARLE